MKAAHRALLSGVAAVTLVAVTSGSAGAARLDDRWHLTVSGTKITGTYTNTTASVVNGFAVGTALKTKNRIVAFTIAGQKCGLYAPYGSAYCYTKIAVKPGETVTFEGETAAPVGNGIVQMCDTADRGMDNTCADVTAKAGSTTSTTPKKTPGWVVRAQNDKLDLEQALREELKAESLLSDFKYTAAEGALQTAIGLVNKAHADLELLKDIVPSTGAQSDAASAAGWANSATTYDHFAVGGAKFADKENGDEETKWRNSALRDLGLANVRKDKALAAVTSVIATAP